MPQCSSCFWFEWKYETIDDGYIKTIKNYCRNFSRKVDPNAKCDDYFKLSTPKDKHYTGDDKKNNSGCFLTSACVEYLGKEDNCLELTALRNFRDGYMLNFEEGKTLVNEYYDIAPKIVEKINASSKKDDYYKYINNVISECLNLLKDADYENVLAKYKKMVRYFKEEFKI